MASVGEGEGRPDDLETLAGYARCWLAERELTPRTREDCGRLLEKLIVPTMGAIQLKHLEPDRIRRWYSTVLSADRPVQRKHAYSLLRSILREAEDEGLIDRNPCRVRNAGKVRRTRDIEPATPPNSTSCWICRRNRARRWCSQVGAV